ncbi:MAG: hypothetical protein ACI8ZN_001395 [Bacteroidia bacterium]|jgi:hypothetical protein
MLRASLFLKSLLILGLVVLTGFQKTTTKTTFSLPYTGSIYTTDNLGNLFIGRTDNSIEKYDLNGQLNARVNFKLYGKLTQLDVSNPFEIYAFYRDQQILLIMDNLLSVQQKINLSDYSIGEITAVCRSFDNGIWFFDSGTMRLKKMDKKGQVLIESMPFGSWTSAQWYPTKMIDNDKNIFVFDPSNGVAIFDVFCNYYKLVPLSKTLDFQVRKSKILYFEWPYLKSFDIKYLKTDSLYFSSSAKNIRSETNLFFVERSDSIFVKKIIPGLGSD